MGKFYAKKTPLLLAALIVLAALLGGCRPKQQTGDMRGELAPDLVSRQPQNSVVAFFKAQDCDLLAPLSFGINSSRDTIWIALEKLLAGPPDAFVDAVIPAGVKLKDLYFAGGVVHLHLTGDEPLEPADINLPAFWGTVNRELLEQDNTTAALQIYYNDEPLSEEPFSMEAPNDFGGGAAGARVYYSDPQAMYLTPLSLPIYAADYQSDEAFLAALLAAWAQKPPEGSGAFSPVPEGLELLGCAFDAERGELTLDLSAAILEMSGSAQQNLLLNSLLATLAPCRQVNSVRLLCHGQPLTEATAGGMDISLPIEVTHDLDMINRVGQ